MKHIVTWILGNVSKRYCRTMTVWYPMLHESYFSTCDNETEA